MKQRLLKTIYSAGGFRPFHFFNRNEVLILTYHRFSKTADQHAISASVFEAQLDYLKKHTNILSLDEVINAFSNDRQLPPNTVAITIDDGYRDAFDVAYPILKKHKIPATLFVITDFADQKIWLWTDLMRFVLLNTAKSHLSVEFEDGVQIEGDPDGEYTRLELAGRVNERLKQMPEYQKTEKIGQIAAAMEVSIPIVPTEEYAAITWEQAREMNQNGVAVESHTVTHPILTNVDAEQLEAELSGSKSVLEQRLEKEIKHFCYPNGAFDRRVRDAVEAAGYSSAVTTEYGFCGAGSDLFELRRIDAQPSIEHFAQSVSGFERLRERIGV